MSIEIVDEKSDLDHNNPVEMDAEEWTEIYSKHPEYDLDHDYSMNS
jgi:hypothetical protein